MIEELEKWVGKHYTEIKVCDNPFTPEKYFRLVDQSKIVSAEYNPKRINVFTDNEGIILKFSVG